MRKILLCLLLACVIPVTANATSLRQEIMLSHRSMARVPALVNVLKQVFPKLEFILHPVESGFYVMGSRDDILSLKAAYPSFDTEPAAWTFDKPESPERLEAIQRVFPSAQIGDRRVQFLGSPTKQRSSRNCAKLENSSGPNLPARPRAEPS